MCRILDIIYKEGSSLEEFYKDPICPKYVPNFSSLTVSHVNVPGNVDLLKFTNQSCSFWYICTLHTQSSAVSIHFNLYILIVWPRKVYEIC